MTTAEQLVKFNHPHMSDSFVELMAADAKAYVGIVAQYTLTQLSKPEFVEKFLQDLVQVGKDTEKQILHDRDQGNNPARGFVPREAKKKSTRRK